MQIDTIYTLVENELKQTERLISDNLRSPIPLINELSDHIIQNGGKRIRPLLALLCAKAVGYSGNSHIQLAAIIELIHTATLLHDDVIDTSTLRRGKSTANEIWGNQASVLVGDYLYSHAFRLMAKMNESIVIDTMAESTNTIVQGEILQLTYQYKPDITLTEYLEIIRCKTGKLFETSAKLGGSLVEEAAKYQPALADFGLHLGMAFQIVDDALDYQSYSDKMGKNPGDDLAEGKTTLPLIYALEKATEEDSTLIRQSLLNGDRSQIDKILQILEKTQALRDTADFAEKIAAKALACLDALPSSEYRDALAGLVEFAVKRGY